MQLAETKQPQIDSISSQEGKLNFMNVSEG